MIPSCHDISIIASLGDGPTAFTMDAKRTINWDEEKWPINKPKTIFNRIRI